MLRAKGSHVFGKVALQLDILTRDQIKACVECQAEASGAERQTLGQVAVAMGFIDAEQAGRIAIVQAFLEAREEDRRFGAVAVENAFITKDQLQDALMLQKRRFKEEGSVLRIGEVLSELTYLTDAQRDAILAVQKRLKSE